MISDITLIAIFETQVRMQKDSTFPTLPPQTVTFPSKYTIKTPIFNIGVFKCVRSQYLPPLTLFSFLPELKLENCPVHTDYAVRTDYYTH